MINDDKHTINILLNHANVLDPNERWLQMVIRAVTANDYGDYICEGRNDLGTGEGRVTLFGEINDALLCLLADIQRSRKVVLQRAVCPYERQYVN